MASVGTMNNKTEPGTMLTLPAWTGSSSTQSPFPSVLTMEYGGPQGAVVAPVSERNSGESGGLGHKSPCEPASSRLELLCGS